LLKQEKARRKQTVGDTNGLLLVLHLTLKATAKRQMKEEEGKTSLFNPILNSYNYVPNTVTRSEQVPYRIICFLVTQEEERRGKKEKKSSSFFFFRRTKKVGSSSFFILIYVNNKKKELKKLIKKKMKKKRA
jgi:hypothetical protein